jgi:hypothetical protein
VRTCLPTRRGVGAHVGHSLARDERAEGVTAVSVVRRPALRRHPRFRCVCVCVCVCVCHAREALLTRFRAQTASSLNEAFSRVFLGGRAAPRVVPVSAVYRRASQASAMWIASSGDSEVRLPLAHSCFVVDKVCVQDIPARAHVYTVARPARLSEHMVREAMVDFALAHICPFPWSLRPRHEGASPEHDDG